MSNGKKYWGSLNLNKIKEAIDGGVTPFAGKNGQYLDVNVWVNEEPDQYGNSCSVQVWNKETKQATYLGNFKLSDNAPKGNEAPKAGGSSDLPF